MKEIHQKLKISSDHYLAVLEIIKSTNYQARLIGGVVRDSILGLQSQDIDIATNMHPDSIINTFSALNYKVIPTGIKFGTVTLLYKGESFEITTLRNDVNTDGRHAQVEYTNDFYSDAIRRDFTINSLSYDPFNEKIYDYFGGIDDLKNGVVKFIGNPDERIQEDYLRILRFFRFFGRFGKNLDHASYEACLKHKLFLKNLSRERIKSEFDLILKLPHFAEVLSLMEPILQEIFPISEDYNKFIKQVKDGVQNYIKYAILFQNTNTSFNELLSLKFSRQEAKCICNLLSLLDKSINEYFLKTLWFENNNFYEMFVFLNIMDNKNERFSDLVQKLNHTQRPMFPINGNDVVSLGITHSAIKTKLANLKQAWIESDFKLTKKQLLEL